MMHYHQFCPIAKAAEIVAERWTPLVVHELLAGSTRFNDIRRGVPLMSQTLLSQRLKELERVGIVERRSNGGRALGWHLTEAGKALGPVIHQLGEWGCGTPSTRWRKAISTSLFSCGTSNGASIPACSPGAVPRSTSTSPTCRRPKGDGGW